MSTFNPDPGRDIHVETGDDGVTIRFGAETLGVTKTTDGFSITNDWNSRHFTLAFDNNSVLSHLTRESDDDRQSGKRAMAFEEFIAEMYGYIRSIATPVPIDELHFEFVGRVDMDEVRTYLLEQDIITDTDAGLRVNPDKKQEAVESLEDNPERMGKFYQSALDEVSFEQASQDRTGENIYVYPLPTTVIVLFFFPDEYVGVTTVYELIDFANIAGGSQIVDHILRSISRA